MSGYVAPNLGPNLDDPNGPLYTFVDTQPLSGYPATPDSSPSHFTVAQITPSAITATFPVVVTCANHGLVNGNMIRATQFITMPYANATGMQQLNNKQFQVQQSTTSTFQLYSTNGLPVDGRNFTTYISGGQFTFAYNVPLIVNPAHYPPPGVPPVSPY